MALTQSTYRIDPRTGEVLPQGTTTWTSLSGTTWNDWTTWNKNYNSQIVYYFGPVDISLQPKNFVLRIFTDSTAEISYEIYTSNTGAYTGEETKTVISQNQTGITGFYGSKAVVAVIANAVAGIPIINSIRYEWSTVGQQQLTFSKINTSTLSGSSTARTLSLNANVGGITQVNIQPYEITAYAVDAYVTNTPTSTYLIPKVISNTSTTLTFALVGVDNQPRDGIVDINLETLPIQYMEGNNLLSN